MAAAPPSTESTSSLVMREFRRFGETTSIRGISRAVKSSDKVLTIIWSLAVVLCGSMLSYQLAVVFIGYFDYSYSTVLKDDDNPSVCSRDDSISGFQFPRPRGHHVLFMVSLIWKIFFPIFYPKM